MRRRFLLSAIPATALMDSAANAAGAAALPSPPAIIGIVGGQIDGTFLRVATDLTSVLNSDALRIMPIAGKGSLQNLDDLLHMPGVDLALVSADTLAYAQAAHLFPDSLSKLQYIAKLYDEDMHVCARSEIRSLADLHGKPVNIDVQGSGTNLTARAVFNAFGILPDFRFDEPAIAQDALQRGTIAANVYVAGKPIRLFADAPGNFGLHFLSIPSSEALEQTYLPNGVLTHSDYPNLIPQEETIVTIGVGVTLMALAGASGSARYRNLVMFVDSFFSRFAELLKPPHHPAWREVNLAAAQPGWPRFTPAGSWIAQHAPPRAAEPTKVLARAEFEAFLHQRGVSDLTAAQREATWEYFQQQQRISK
jgi:TRAP transporter TAXI family solute receptor